MSALRLDQLLASAAYRNLMKKWSRRRLIAERQANVRFGSKADPCVLPATSPSFWEEFDECAPS